MTTPQSWCAAPLAASLLIGCAVPAAAQLRDAQERSLTAGDGTEFVVTTGIVRVPELRADRTPGAIDLSVVRVRRAGSTSRRAHVILAGGPGDSGVNLALGIARQGGGELADIFDGDVIGIDQRGTGMSTPNLASPARYNLPLDRPGSPDVWLPIVQRTTREVAAGFRARGIRLEAYNTRESADDVDAVRRAFGYEKVTLWGRSYGSHLALATLARHPDTVERLILVSPEGPDHTWKLPSHVDAVLERLGRRAPMPDLPGLIRRVLDRLRQAPAVVSVTHPVTRQPATVHVGVFDVQWLTAQALGDPRTLVTIPAAYREMADGNYQRIAQLALMRRERLGVVSAVKHLMDLSSGASAERRARIEREAATALLGNALNFPGMYLEEPWDARDLGDDFRRPVKSDVPTLIVVGDLDPRTPVENAREIATTLGRSHLVVLENATHQFDLFGNASIRALIATFLRGEPIGETRLALPALRFDR